MSPYEQIEITLEGYPSMDIATGKALVEAKRITDLAEPSAFVKELEFKSLVVLPKRFPWEGGDSFKYTFVALIEEE